MGFSTNVKKGWYIIHTIGWVYRPTQMGNNHLNTNNWFPDFRFFFNLKSLFLILTSSTCRQLLHWFLKFFTLRDSPWWALSTCPCPVHTTVLGCESFESSLHSRLGQSHWASQAGLLHHSGLGKQIHPDPANQSSMYWYQYLYTHLVI